MKPPGLRFKLTFFYTAIFTGLIAVMYLVAYYLLSDDMEGAATTELLERSSALRGVAQIRPVTAQWLCLFSYAKLRNRSMMFWR